MNQNKQRTEDASADKTNSTTERPRGGVSPHAGELESTPGIASRPGDEDRDSDVDGEPAPATTIPDAAIGDNS